MILIGYSGHSYVVSGILRAQNLSPTGYCDKEEKSHNPLSLSYYQDEMSETGLKALRAHGFFIAVGNNIIRRSIFERLAQQALLPLNAIHPHTVIDSTAAIASAGVMIAGQVVINAFAKIGKGAICNSACIIEHECEVGDFAHIGPGAVLCGNVQVGEGSFIGANSVVREGINIGRNVIVGAGSVVIKNIPDNAKVAGNPSGTIGAR